MTTYDAFAVLLEKLDGLGQALDHLTWAIIQVQPPPEDDQSPAGQLNDLVQELLGEVNEAREIIGDSLSLTRGTIYLSGMRQALIGCQKRCTRVTEGFYARLATPDTINMLDYLLKEEQKAWRQWACGVSDALERCRTPIYDINQAQLNCWQELSELSEPMAVSVLTTNTSRSETRQRVSKDT